MGHWKLESGLPAHDPGREEQILSKVVALNRGPLPESAVRAIFRTLIRECRAYEAGVMARVDQGQRQEILASTTVSIVGLGLMGASIAEALRVHLGKIPELGYEPNPRDIHAKKGFVRQLSDNVEEALAADLVILAMPVGETVKCLRNCRGSFRPGSLIIDLGSTKRVICETAWQILPPDVNFIGGHPLAGKASSGAENADANLFLDKWFALCPNPKEDLSASEEALESLFAMVRGIGAHPITVSPERHDEMLAFSSHLPQLVSIALAETVQHRFGQRGFGEFLYGPAFREMTRLCASDYAIWSDILESTPLLQKNGLVRQPSAAARDPRGRLDWSRVRA